MKTWIVAIALLVSTPALAGGKVDKANAAKRNWSECVQTSISKWSASPESIDLLVRAALGRCATQASAYRAAYRDSTREYGFADPDSDEEIEATVDKTRDAIKSEALASLLDARAEMPRTP